LIECQVRDCRNNDRGEESICKLKPDDIRLNSRGNCMSYILDMEWLRESWWG